MKVRLHGNFQYNFSKTGHFPKIHELEDENMKKRFLTLLIVLCLVACAIPVSAFALTDSGNNDTLPNAQRVTLGETIN